MNKELEYTVIKNETTDTYRIWKRSLGEWVTNDWHLQRWAVGAYETRWQWLAERMARKLEKQRNDWLLVQTWNDKKPL